MPVKAASDAACRPYNGICCTNGIDMDRVAVLWMTNGTVLIIPHNQGSLLICPNWTITGKYNQIPGYEAGADTILDPHE
jgi:hypothetical protein